jgi:hypothetical protein
MTPEAQQLVAGVTERVHADKIPDAAKLVAKTCGITLEKGEKPAVQVLQYFLHTLLDGGAFAEAAQLLWTTTQFNPNPGSTKEVWGLFDTADTGLIMGAAKMSKCILASDLCRKFDLSLSRADAVRVGDVLMGDDGTPRNVLETVSGREPMWEIKPDHAPAFCCTADHVLTLVCTWTRRNNGGRYGISSGYTPGKIVDVPLRDYLGWSKTRKRAYRLFVKPAVSPAKELRVDPYIYGAWLGDGTCCRCDLTSPEGPMVSEWIRYWRSLGFRVEKIAKYGWSARHQTPEKRIWPNFWIRSSVVNGVKRIFPEYLAGSFEQRMQLLAGLIDSDGTSVGAGYDIVTKWPGLADDIEALARSLGFLVSRSVRKHSIKSIGFSAEYAHLYLRGPCDLIPTKEKRIGRVARKSMTGDVMTTRFSVTPVGEQKYAGFMLDGNHRFQLASGIITHNSFSMGVRLFLEWVRDPEFTSVRVLGPSEDHLEQNLFSHLVSLHQHATLPMPGTVGNLFIGLSRRDQLSSIRGVVIPKGTQKKAGRLQGSHRRPRPAPHPIFGPLSRLFIFLDEIENIPTGVWQDIDNVLSEIEKGGQGFKVFGAYNPTNPTDEVGKRAEPPFGWSDLDEDTHFRWKSARGWDVLRLDGERCENVIGGQVIYPGLQTRDGLERIAQNAGGRMAAGYRTMGRGLYPTTGIEAMIIPLGMLEKMRGEFIWYQDPRPVGATDLALEGSDGAVHTLGDFGMASGIKYPPSLDYPKGRTLMFKDDMGNVVPRWGLQAKQQFVLPKGDTVAMKNAILDINRKAGVRPDYYACDRTGHGAGVADLLRYEWSTQIHDINYTSAASDSKIMLEDSRICKEEYERVFTELWFAVRLWGEFGYLLLHPIMDLGKLTQQLTQRRFFTRGSRKQVESKTDYKSRGFESPGEADSLTLLLHAARKGSGVIPSMRGAAGPSFMAEDEDWGRARYPGGVRIDVSNQSPTLDDRVVIM